MGPEDLKRVLKLLPDQRQAEEVLVGLETPDDAGVYLLDEENALVHTLDFFTPIVDDPYLFGQIAATNSLSDVYAMGGTPLSAMNIVCFPCSLDMDILAEILRGGADKLREAGVALLGGHTVDDQEPKYGMAVTGKVHPKKILRNRGAQPGDLLVLTKPLGTGVLASAIKADFLTERDATDAIQGMVTLNRKASEAALRARARAATDVTGFGLLGHLATMLPERSVGCELYLDQVPYYEGTREMAESGMVPGGAYRNRDFMKGRLDVAEGLDELELLLLCDPQTSGGLLLALPEEGLEAFQEAMKPDGFFRVIGKFTTDEGARITIR